MGSRGLSRKPWPTRSRDSPKRACVPTGARLICSKACRSARRCARSGTTAFPPSRRTAPRVPRASPQARAGMATSATSERPRGWLSDSSVWSLVAANSVALGLALYQHWSLASLLILYWAQSIIIGVANVFRILNLERFSTANFTINNRPVEPTPQLKRQAARFFALHYGVFHAVYLGFIVAFPRGEALWTWPLALGVAVFALNHLWSYRRNRAADRQGTPNIGILMFMPYGRIVPMHAIVLSGLVFAPTGIGIVIFIVLKTAADVAMHIVEHAVLKKLRPPAAAAAADAAPLRAPPRS